LPRLSEKLYKKKLNMLKSLLSQSIVFFNFLVTFVCCFFFGSSDFSFLGFAFLFSLNQQRLTRVSGLLIRSTLLVRFYSNNVNTTVPVIRYLNAELDKAKILKDNKGKTGIYR
jgi:hypothetical protein